MVSVDNNGNSKEFFDSGKLKGGVKKREVDKKFHQLFDMLDSDGNKILDSNEVNNLTSIINVQDKDSATKEYVADFAQSLSEASENIIDSKTTVNSDGTKTIVTLFNNNTMETVTYYPDGEIKMKRVDKKVTQKTYTIGNTTYTEAEFNKLLNNPELSNALATAIPGENTSIATKIEFSERGKQELKEFTGTHFKDTVDEQYNMMKKFDYTSGDLDKVGVFLSDSAQELYSELSGGEYNTYAELWHIVNENKKNADSLAFTTKIDPNSPWAKTHPDVQTDFEKVYQDTTGQKYDILKADEFQRTAVKYQTVTALKQRTEYLNESIKKIDKLYHEEQLRKQGITVPDREETFDEVLMDTLTNYFGSEEIAATFLGGVSEGIESIKDVTPDKMNEMLKEIKRMTEERYQSVLGDEKYENLHSRYLKEYKEFYGVENLKDDIESSISTGQMTGEMLKMGVVITTSIMLGGSTLLQQGGKALAAKLGPKAAKEAIRLGMSFGSIGESYGIDLLNAMSSKEGLTEEKKDLLIQKQISSLPYVLFGAYVSGPIGDSVKNFLKSNPSASSNMLNTLFAKTSSSAGFTSEVTADALLELTLQGGNLSAVFGSNAQGEAFGRFMNMLIGGRANKGAFNALQDVKIQQNKLPDGSIEYTTINKDGVEFKTKNPDEIVLGLLGVAAQKSTEGRNIKTMPDGTVIEVNKDGSTTVLSDVVERPHVPRIQNETGQSDLTARLDNAQSREDFITIRDEIKNMPAGEEKTALMSAYQKKYREFSTAPERPDIRMEYKPEGGTGKTEYQISKEKEENLRNKIIEYLENNTDYNEKLEARIQRYKQKNGDEITPEYLQEIKDSFFKRYSEDADNLELPADLKAELVNYIKENKDYNYNQDIPEDEISLYDFTTVYNNKTSARKKLEFDLIWVACTRMENNGASDEEIQAILTKIKNNEFKKLSDNHLYELKEMLINAEEVSFEEFLKRVNFDNSKLETLDFSSLTGETKNPEKIAELLYCTDEEYAIKQQRIKDRAEDLPQNNSPNGIKQWKIILNMSDEDYALYQKLKSDIPEGVVITDIQKFAEFKEKYKNNPDITSLYETAKYYSEDEIYQLAELSESNPDLVLKMAKEKQHSFFGPDKPKYSVEEIQKIVEYNKINERLLNKLVEAKYDSEEIDWVFNLLNTNEKLVNDLLKSDRFKDFNKMTINNLVQIANKDSELVNTILNETAEKFDGSQKQRFDKYDIQSLISALTTNDFENFDYIKNLINLKDKSGKFRLDSNSIIKLGEKYSQDKNLVMELLDAKNLNGDYRFSGTDITTLIPILKGRNSEFAKKLLNEKVGNEYRFEPFNIQSILDANKINEQFTKYLLDAKKSDNTPRFTGDDIKNIVNANEINPDKVKELLEIKTVDSDGKPTFAFNGSSILNFVKDETNYDLRNKLLSIKSPDNSYNLLSGYDIDNIISMYEKNADAVTELVNNKKYNMFLKNINARNIELFANKNLVNEISNEIPENTVDYSFSRPYLENQWQVTFKTDDGSKTLFINKNNDSYTISARETTHKQGDNTRVRKEFADGTVLVEEIQYTNISADNTTIPFPNSLKKTLYDNQGVQTRSEVIAPSQDKPGAYTINVYERGLNQRMKKKPAGTVQMYGSKNQGSKTVRTVTSEDGSITSHTIIQGPKGSGMTYQIKDKNGNILANIERRHRKIDDNHYTSSFNGQKYDMQFSNDKITVSKTDNDGNVIETIELDSNQLDFNLIDLYKQLPGDYLFKIKDMNTKITFDNSNKITDKNNACFSFVDNTIYISSELKNNPFVFAHELGHAIDFNSGIISKNPDLAKVYQEELEAYKSATSDAEGQSIDYFTNQENGTAIPESIAETHALMSGMINEDFNTIMLRSVVLQQHFPKTIAKISELIQTTPIQKNNQGNNGSLQHIPEQYVMRPNRPHLPEPGSLKKIPTDLKDISKITPEITQEELNIESGTIIEYINPNAAKDKLDKPENKRLTEQGEELVWRAAEGLRQNALSVENDIVKFMYEAGLAKDETLSHRSKGLQSLHDKLRTYLIENPDKTLEDAIRSVKDSIGVRTVNKSVSFANHPEVKELLEKGDIKSAQLKAVELESDYVLQGLMGIIDKMADGTADIKLTRVANYMGEDGIPYFTENQLNKLRNHAYSKGIDIPIVERTTNAAERVSADDIYNENASTKIRKSGYTALQMNFVTKDGDIFEWQYRGDKLNDFGEGEHVPYDLRTGKDIIGNDKVLTPLYEPMKELLQNKDIMPDNLYKEYNAYLTAHYKYLRLTELGFEAEKPKLPKGIDERLRADNLILLHDIADKLKKGKITQEEALKEYNDKLIRNTDDNVTDISYKDALTNIVNDADIDRYEARVRLSKRGDNKTVDYSILTKSCMDKSGKIKNNLVRLAEDLRSKGINDDIIASFLNKFKNDNGQIPSDIMNNFNQFINNYKQGVLNNRVISAFLAIPYKSGTKNLDMSFMPKIIELSKEKTIPLKALQTMSDVYSKIDINKSPDGYDYLTAVTKNIFSRNDKILNDLRDADLKNILSSLIAKDGSIDKNAGDIVSALFDVNLGKNKIAQLISSSKNTLTGKIDDSFKNDLLQFISMGKNIKPAYTQYTIQQLIAASTITKNTIINGKNTVYNIHDLTEFKKYFNEYVNQQKQMGITKYPIEHLRNASLIFKVIKNPDGTINTAKQQLAKSMIANKFTTSAIQEVIIRASNPNGTLNPRIVQAFVKNYNNLPKEEKANLISVDIKLEQGILRQTMRFKDGSSKIFDINPVNVDVKIPYDIQTRKSNNNNLYIKLKDSQRGKTTKTTSKNGKTISEITIINDVNGNKIGTEYVSRSSAGDGILDVRFRDNEGNTHILSSAERDLNGNLVVKKDFYSNNGTRTQYDYTENPNGSYNSTYIITDSSGKVLLNENRTFTVIDETHFKSSINEQEYDIQIDDLNVMTVTNSAGEKVRFDLDSKTLNNYNDFKYLLTRIPGHEFFNMAKTGLASISFMSENNAHYIPGENVIELGNGHNTLSTFFHEFGHNKDWLINSNNYRNVIRDDKQFLQIYENERIAFMKDFPNLQRDFISYFISLDNPQSRGNQSQREVIAESNNILSTPKQGEGMEFRKYYLQRYFPETIAYLAKKLNPDVYNK